MDPEHQIPEATDNSDIDPSIKPENLVVQDGKDQGKINAFETEQGTAVEMLNAGDNKFEPVPIPNIPDSEQPYTTEGLPVIGAEAENTHRDEGYIPSKSDMEEFKKRSNDSSESILYGKVPEGTTPEQMADILHDLTGTEAMAEAVKTKAVEYAKKNFPLLDQGEFEKFGQKIAGKFKEELEKKNSEAKAKQKKDLEDLMNSLDSPDTSLSDVVPELSEPESEAKNPGYIDTSAETPFPLQGHN